jgi:hypothetical protein
VESLRALVEFKPNSTAQDFSTTTFAKDSFLHGLPPWLEIRIEQPASDDSAGNAKAEEWGEEFKSAHWRIH